jgi:hypothetical protein
MDGGVVSSDVVRKRKNEYLVYLLVFHAYFYWRFKFLKGSLRDVFISRSALKGWPCGKEPPAHPVHSFICKRRRIGHNPLLHASLRGRRRSALDLFFVAADKTKRPDDLTPGSIGRHWQF